MSVDRTRGLRAAVVAGLAVALGVPVFVNAAVASGSATVTIGRPPDPPPAP